LAKSLAFHLLNRTAVSGIIGKVSFDPREPLAVPVLEQMLDASAVAVDVGRGIYTAPGIAIGWSGAGATTSHRPAWLGAPCCSTASVIDQVCKPLLCAADAQLTNARALRSELVELGHRFDGIRDHEVILHAYQQWGHGAFARLRGPFACAIWDAAERRLVLARDHVGIRPLHFAVLPDQGVAFATEIRALLRDPALRREWSPDAVDAYLTLGYVPAPLTAYRRISKLEAAHLLVIEGRRLHVEPYWDVPRPQRSTLSERDAVASIADRLREATADRANGSDAAGFLYSGGTASTALLAAAPASPGTIVTVALDQDASEVVRSGRAASMLGRPREIESLTPDVPALARRLAAASDEPIADPSAILQLSMCLAARRHASVALTAHGAATLWADHARHRVERIETIARTWLGRPLSSLGAEIGRSLPESMKGARALSHLGMPAADAYAVKHAYGLWDDDHRRTLYTRRFAWEVRDSNPFARHLELYASRDTADPLDRAVYVDTHTSLADSVLSMATAAARAADLQLRFPMLAVDFVEYTAATPTSLKQRGRGGMYALRAALARELPASLMPPANRVPARYPWLRSALDALVPRVLFAPRFDGRGIVSRPVLRRLWDDHQRGSRDHGHRLWSLLMLELWLRDATDGNAAEVPLEYAILTPRRPAAGPGDPNLKAA
jgi:asparagine synthase (glutamine-hydrolysing)